MRNVYIYGLYDPRTDEIRYVGKTVNQQTRLWSHVRNNTKEVGTNAQKSAWVNELKSLNLKPIMKIIEVCNDDTWPEREKYWIGYYQKLGKDLFNIFSGGDKIRDWSFESRAKNKKAKLNGYQVKYIRFLYQAGFALQEIADQFGVCYSLVDYIVRNKKWYDPNYTPNPRRTFHIITEEEAFEIRKLHNEGLNREELRIRFDSSSNVIQDIIENRRFPDPNYTRKRTTGHAPFTEDDIAEINRLYYQDGYTVNQLKELFHAAHSTIKKNLRGKFINRQGRRRIPVAVLSRTPQ